MSRDPEDLSPQLRAVWRALERWWNLTHPGLIVKLSWTHRPLDEQERMWNDPDIHAAIPGDSLHGVDGEKPAYALDFYFENLNGHAVWTVKYYIEFAATAKLFGLVWGGDWDSRDYGHLQMPMTARNARVGDIPELGYAILDGDELDVLAVTKAGSPSAPPFVVEEPFRARLAPTADGSRLKLMVDFIHEEAPDDPS